MTFDLRPARQNDVSFLFATWLRSQRNQGDRRFMTNSVYFHGEHRRLEKILRRPTVAAWILCNPEDPEQLYGYVVAETLGPVFMIHFAYVKKTYRGLGMMREAVGRIYPELGREEVAITHISDDVKNLRNKYRLKFNPFLEEIER